MRLARIGCGRCSSQVEKLSEGAIIDIFNIYDIRKAAEQIDLLPI